MEVFDRRKGESPRAEQRCERMQECVCACAILHAGHACTFVPADATLIANSTQPLCKRCLFSFQGPKRSLCNYANEKASSYTHLRQCVIKCVRMQFILQNEYLLFSPTGN